MTSQPRLVVCFRWHTIETEPRRYLAAAERVARRAAQVGGRGVSWGSDRYAFDFDPASFRLVLKTVLDLLSEANTHAVGIANRELFSDQTARYWGPGLVVAEAIAGVAAPGEILLDPEIEAVQLSLLVTLGSIPVRVGDERVSAALVLPGSCPPDGFKAGVAETRMAAAEGYLDHPESVPASKAAAQERPSVLEALRSGDPARMTRLASELRESGGPPMLASRLEALASLARGDLRAGLGRLAEAAQEARLQGLAEECQAVLAYAVGLSQAGKSELALLQALRALSVARRRGDTQGVRAAVQLVTHLAQAAGEAEVAGQWAGQLEA